MLKRTILYYNLSGDCMKYIFLLNQFSLKTELTPLKKKIEKVCNKRKIDYIIEINNIDISTEDILKKYKHCLPAYPSALHRPAPCIRFLK